MKSYFPKLGAYLLFSKFTPSIFSEKSNFFKKMKT